mmetsp:Transcript_20173/g.42040  ORF Transcript_20173/g.42040 Transcript_20173/m.42040 type:complete len:246 (-) Transcript_20173:293-1030(-)
METPKVHVLLALKRRPLLPPRLFEALVSALQAPVIALLRVRPVHDGVLVLQGLVEVPVVLGAAAPDAGVHQRPSAPDRNRDGSCPARGPSRPGRVHGHIRDHADREPAVPVGRRHVVKAVQEGCGAAVASVEVRRTLQILVVREQLRQRSLNRLALVCQRLRSDFEPAHLVRVDAVLPHEGAEGRQSHRRAVLRVARHAHLALPEPLGELSRADAARLLQVGLREVRAGEVRLEAEDAREVSFRG